MLICESAADYCPTVDADQYGCSTAIVDYLMSKGHKTVYHIAGPSTSRAAENRARGRRQNRNPAGTDRTRFRERHQLTSGMCWHPLVPASDP